MSTATSPAPAHAHPTIVDWVAKIAELTTPTAIHWCDGSPSERQGLIDGMVELGTLTPLSPEKRPNSYLARSHPSDVARVEARTFICSEREEDAGPTNNWADPKEMLQTLSDLFEGTMAGRTMYVVPFA
ncbi:MAG TPA: phosphoenolpyruvate carboxykinase, partial [Demequinaceae bacterium]